MVINQVIMKVKMPRHAAQAAPTLKSRTPGQTRPAGRTVTLTCENGGFQPLTAGRPATVTATVRPTSSIPSSPNTCSPKPGERMSTKKSAGSPAARVTLTAMPDALDPRGPARLPKLPAPFATAVNWHRAGHEPISRETYAPRNQEGV